jgi:LPS sulfotransferase NodH
MLHLHKNFIVFGPAGRCGSHWVETTLKNIVGASHTIGSFTMLSTGWIYHTNEKTDLIEMPSESRNSATLVYCVRKNHFDVAISFLVAEITNEWNAYTSKTVEPFVVDTVRFKKFIKNLHYYQTKEIPEDILPLFTDYVTIDYDRLISSAIPEKYIADQLGIDYNANKNYGQPGSAPSNKNTRNYKDLILNWDELVDIYKVFSADYHTQ